MLLGVRGYEDSSIAFVFSRPLFMGSASTLRCAARCEQSSRKGDFGPLALDSRTSPVSHIEGVLERLPLEIGRGKVCYAATISPPDEIEHWQFAFLNWLPPIDGTCAKGCSPHRPQNTIRAMRATHRAGHRKEG